ncbi:MAG: hypothetical protein L6416_03690 [Candidatus Omnitrophica bacterium]|nr:hypothetical protein [Candidatus Omnitrophota bacterium]
MIKPKNKFIFAAGLIAIIGIILFVFLSNDRQFASYVGSKKSNIYHRLDCPLVKDIEKKDKIWFDATIINENVKYNGKQYFPCQVCKPPYKKLDD